MSRRSRGVPIYRMDQSGMPPMPEREAAALRRRCLEMLLDGYDLPTCVERFGITLVQQVRASMTEAQSKQRHEMLYNATPAVLRLADRSQAWLAQGGTALCRNKRAEGGE
jgi:hypothetical protein